MTKLGDSLTADVPDDRSGLVRDLARLVGRDAVHTEGPPYVAALQDATAFQDFRGQAEALVLPGSAEEVAAVLSYGYAHELPMTPRGGGTGLAGGAVPEGGLVIGLERLNRIRSITPELWRIELEAGVRTGDLHRIAHENGLFFPPDPGASEQSTIGGNIATNAGGPHAFKYGVTGAWVTGLEVVVAPGEILRTGGPFRKDVSGLDLTALIVGSEGTLGVVTAAWLRLLPAPDSRALVIAFYPDAESGCEAATVLTGSGLEPTAIEFLDRGALKASLGSFPFGVPTDPGFALFAEVDGTEAEVARQVGELSEAMSPGALAGPLEVTDNRQIERFWKWRSGVSFAIAALRGGKISEDVVVPRERLAESVESIREIGSNHRLEACSWGHAGDGNLHATFMVDLADRDEMARAKAATGELFELALRLGGSLSGEHGIGTLKAGYVKRALDPATIHLQRDLKRDFDPKNLLNPGKKIPVE